MYSEEGYGKIESWRVKSRFGDVYNMSEELGLYGNIGENRNPFKRKEMAFISANTLFCLEAAAW